MRMTRRSSPKQWRLLDTGELSAAGNIALDATLLEMRAAGEIPSTLRFLRFSPPAALAGFHQSIEQEIRTSFCAGNGIDVNRRLTGGGAVFFDAGQIGWELVADRHEIEGAVTMADLTKIICGAVVRGLGFLQVKADFRPRNDIEVGGRKISGTGGAYEGSIFLFQGTLLVDFDVGTMLRALKVPIEKLSRRELASACERVTSLAELLPVTPSEVEIKKALARGISESLGVDFHEAPLSPAEEERAAGHLRYYSSDSWLDEVTEPADGHRQVSSFHQADGGLVRASAAVDLRRKRLKSVLFTGDFFINPARAVFDLEARLRGGRLDELRDRIEEFFREEQPETIGLYADDFSRSLIQALDKLAWVELGISPDEVKGLALVSAAGDMKLKEALEQAGVLLLPYCAKLPGCEYRDRDGCDECGDCSAGEAYGLAGELDLPVITINNYEHLETVFRDCREAGVTSYIGCCCRAFLEKHYDTFRNTGMTGVLMDIADTTCYELKREEEAYAGRFENLTSIRTDLLEKVLRHVPRRDGASGTSLTCASPAEPLKARARRGHA